MRGIAIILVVLGHSIGFLENPLNRVILSFHMPLFFFISGILAKTKTQQGDFISFKCYLMNKTKTILIPQIILFVEKVGIDYFKHQKITGSLLLTEAFNWFLIVLFYVVILFYVCDKIALIEKKWLLLFLTFLFIVVVVEVLNLKTIFHIEILPVAFLFYLSGYYTKNNLLKKEKSETKKILSKNLWIFSLPVMAIISVWNSPIAMYNNDYGNLILFGLTSVLGIWGTYEISIRIYDNNILRWYGKNSIVIYIFHFGFLNVLHGLGTWVFPFLFDKNYLYPAYLCYFLVTMILLTPMIYICNRYLWFLFGKKRHFKGS